MSKVGWLKTADGLQLEMELGLDPKDGEKFSGVAVVCHPHPGFGGDMHNAVVRSLASAAWEEGFVPLLFNFRGTGRSEGTQSGGVKEVDDVDAAMSHAKKLAKDGCVILMGYSFGAKVATTWLNDGGRANAFVGVAVPSTTDYPDYKDIPSLYITGEFDDVAPLDDGLSRSLMTGGLHVVVEGSDHFFHRGRDEIQEAVQGFINITCPIDGRGSE
ncbi:MAG: alpha/beta hydrolase [Thermoplasmata archaeon]|nr:MAG: alpha/beta hydrolase [Thermoplasmata archaeon]